MTVDALEQCVCTSQRKAILVVADFFQRHLPTAYGVAAFTVCAELAAMDIRVAICAMGTYIFEDQVSVALSTCHFLVHAAQGITSVVMIELWTRAYRFPTRVRVALLAGNGNGAVRVRHLGLGAAHGGSRAVSGLLHGRSSEQWDQSNKNGSKPARTFH